jgi:hypothetical protein
MAKKRNTLKEILEEKIRLIEAVESGFLKGIEGTEKALFAALLKLLRQFSNKGGRFVKDRATNALILKLKREILQTIRRSTYLTKIEDYLTNFDEVERLNRLTYSQTLQREINLSLNAQKKLAIEELTDALTGQSALNSNFVNPIRKMMLNAVALGQTLEETEENLRRFVRGNNQQLGRFRAYTGQVARDALNGWDGLVNDTIRDRYDLDGFMYVGSIVRDSRPNCVHLVSGSGQFSDLSIRPGVFAVSDIPKIISRARGGKGFNPNVTPETFAQYRMGYNCRHQIIYIRLTDEEMLTRLEKLADNF